MTGVTGRSNRAAISMYTRCGLRGENNDDVVFNLMMEPDMGKA